MKTAYYKATHAVSLAIMGDWKTNRLTGDKMQEDLCARYGADHILEHRGYITGLAMVCESRADDPWTEKHGDRLGLKIDYTHHNGKLYATYQPHMGRKIGKSLKAEFDVVNNERSENPQSLNKYLLKKFNLDRMVLDGGASTMRGTPMRNAYGGYCKNEKDILVLAIPYEDDWKGYGKSHMKPESIEGFTQIKKSEFIALTEDEEL